MDGGEIESSPLGIALGALDDASAEVEDADRELLEVTTRAQTRLDQALDVLRMAVRRLAQHDELEPSQRHALARRVYWSQTRISVREIVDAFGYAHQADLLAIVGATSSGVPCEHCGDVLRAKSRTRMKEIRSLASGKSRRPWKDLSCETCSAAKRAERDAENAAYWRRSRMLLEANVTMRVDAWHAAAMLILEYPPLLSRDDGAWDLREVALELQAAALTSAPDESFSVRYRAAEQVAEAVGEILSWDELRATRLAQSIGYPGTARALARLLVEAVAEIRASVEVAKS